MLDVEHAPLCLILSGELSYCDCSTCSAFSIRTLAKTKEDFIFCEIGRDFSLHVKQGEQHKTHKRRIKMSGGTKYYGGK